MKPAYSIRIKYLLFCLLAFTAGPSPAHGSSDNWILVPSGIPRLNQPHLQIAMTSMSEPAPPSPEVQDDITNPEVEAQALLRLAVRALKVAQTADARILLQWIIRDYVSSNAATAARAELARLEAVNSSATPFAEKELPIRSNEAIKNAGRAEFLATQTLAGTYVGAVLSILEAEDPQQVAGLVMVSTVGGLGASLLYSKYVPVTQSDAALVYFSEFFGALNFGMWTVAVDPDIYLLEFDNRKVPIMSLVGLGAGAVAGRVIGNRFDPSEGQVSAVASAGFWTSALMNMFVASLSLSDDFLDTSTILTPASADIAIVASIAALSSWDINLSRGRVRLINLGGLVGGILGGSLIALANVNDGSVVLRTISLFSAGGLVAGTVATRNWDVRYHPELVASSSRNCLVSIEQGKLALGSPVPQISWLPTAFSGTERLRFQPRVSLDLVSGSF